ncbi:MAG TPA: fluoride efflux transporter CrcB [Solirubrobacteraceae bacterium]|nr:fluoride efflux transporter CrcB [Solirubrobacteraceae bacterium]
MPRLDRRELASIFAGGVAGAIVRVWVGRHLVTNATWPWATLLINLSGSVLLAYSVTRLQERLPLSTYRRPFLGTGFCGAFTTFSTLEVEILDLLRAGRIGPAIGYAAASVVGGYLAIWVTTALVRRWRTPL